MPGYCEPPPPIKEFGFVNMCCPRCGSRMIFAGTCIKCGELLLQQAPPYATRSCDYAHKNKSYSASQEKYRLKPCRNCGRVKWNVGDHLCGACKAQVYNPAKGIKINRGTKEYELALISYRRKKWPEKFGNGDNER